MKPLMCALGALLFLNGCGGASAESSTNPSEVATADLPDAEAVRVEIVTLEPSDASITLELPGEIQGSEDALLAAALGGFVEEVRVDNGDEVRRGDVLVVVDRRTRAAQAAQAEAQLQQAEADLRRQQALGELASAATLQQLETAVAIATAGAELARTQLSRATIRAPFDGVIGGIDIEVGEVANPGAPVARLVKLDPIKVQLSVSDRDV
ncbi:MAG: efflux RND transporter periplasmic adaptor subunit, partial [Myxococcota bacterium]